MSSRAFVSALVVVILTVLPVSGTLCALACDATTTAASQHGSSDHCEERAPSHTTGARVSGAPDHDCSTHDAAIRQPTLTPGGKMKTSIASIALAAGSLSAGLTSTLNGAWNRGSGSPPRGALLTPTHLVLRI